MIRTASLIVSLIFLSPAARAGLFRFDSDTQLAASRASTLSNQQEVYQFIQSSYQSDLSAYAADTSFSVYDNTVDSQGRFDLYALSGRYKPVDSVRISFGRQFNSYLLARTAVTDSLMLEWTIPKTGWSVFAFGGRQVQNEIQHVETNTDLAGGGVSYRSAALFPLRASLSMEHLNYRDRAYEENVTKYTLAKQLNLFWEPDIQFDGESDLKTGHANRLELAGDFYPDHRDVVGLRALQYEMSSMSGWEDPVSTIITRGRLYEGGLTWSRRVSERLGFTSNLGLDQYDLGSSATARGGRFSLSGDFKLSAFSRLSDQVLYLSSYGGNAIANIFLSEYYFWRQLALVLNSEVVSYQKVTSSKRNAYSTQAGIGSWMLSQFKIQLLGEFNQNNEVQNEFRVLLRVNFMEWRTL